MRPKESLPTLKEQLEDLLKNDAEPIENMRPWSESTKDPEEEPQKPESEE